MSKSARMQIDVKSPVKKWKQADQRKLRSAKDVLSKFRKQMESASQQEQLELQKVAQQGLTALGFGLREYESGTALWDGHLTGNQGGRQLPQALTNTAIAHWCNVCKNTFGGSAVKMTEGDLKQRVNDLLSRHHVLLCSSPAPDRYRPLGLSPMDSEENAKVAVAQWSKCREMLRKCHPWNPKELDWESVHCSLLEVGVMFDGIVVDRKGDTEKFSDQPLSRPDWWKIWLDTVRLDLDCYNSGMGVVQDFLFDEPKQKEDPLPPNTHTCTTHQPTRTHTEHTHTHAHFAHSAH